MALQAVVIYDSILFNRGHNIREWAEALERRFVRYAKQEAPVRSGELVAGISGTVVRSGPKHLTTTIVSAADHTMYVLKGTTGPIMSRRMWGFRQRTGLQIPRGAAFDRNPMNTRSGNVDRRWLREHGYMLKVRAGNGFPQRYAMSVRGQDANNFFGRAADRTAIRHSSLRGFRPATNF